MAEMDPKRRGWDEPAMLPAARQSRLKRLFKDREILLRSDDKVRHIHLTPGIQMTFATLLLAGVTWMTGSTAVSWYQNTLLDQRRVEIVEAKLAYDSVLGELGAYQKRLKTISNQISERLADNAQAAEVDGDFSTDMQAFVSVGRALTRTLNQAYIDLDVPPEERHRLIASRNVLHGKIKELEATLADAQDAIKGLERNVRIREVSLDELRQTTTDLQAERDELENRVVTLTDSIGRSRNNSSRLVSEIEDLNSQLQEALENGRKLDTEKTILASNLETIRGKLDKMGGQQRETESRLQAINRQFSKVAQITASASERERTSGELAQLGLLEMNSSSILNRLESNRQSAEKTSATLVKVLDGLTRVAGYDQIAELRDKGEVEQALVLLGEIESLHDTQMGLVNRLSEGTNTNIIQMESMLAATGLDVNKMLAESGLSVGQGGPELTGDFAGGSSADLSVNVSHLESKVQHWQALQQMLACTPMIAPVDYYHVTSKYGPRKDPFTGKRAVHKGVDMGGWPGTPVYATAGGTVTKAGNSNRYGRMVEIDHGCGIKTRYGHLKKVLVKRGQKLDHRHVIGKLGSTGRSTGPHVHYEVRVNGEPLDPQKFIDAGRYVFKS